MDVARGRLLRSRRALRIQRPASTDTSKKLTDRDEDEQVLRHGGKPRHFLERLLPHGRLVTRDFAHTGDAEEDALQHASTSVVGALFCDPLRFTTFEP